jgi:DNA-binding IclR family transcriptional regulator
LINKVSPVIDIQQARDVKADQTLDSLTKAIIDTSSTILFRALTVDNQEPLSTSENNQRGMSNSVLRVTALLDIFLLKVEPLSVQMIVQESGLSRTTVYEIIRSLVAGEYLEKRGKPGHFFLGRRLYELGMAYRDQVNVLKEGHELIEKLRNECNETAQLSVLDEDKILVLLKSESDQSVTIISKIGSRIPVNWAASGRLLISNLTDDELRKKLPHMIEPSPTGKAPTDIEILIREIREARESGYALQIRQSNPHTGAVSAPVFDSTNKCIATVSVVVPDHRLKRQHQRPLIDAVVRAAANLSRRLGG